MAGAGLVAAGVLLAAGVSGCLGGGGDEPVAPPERRAAPPPSSQQAPAAPRRDRRAPDQGSALVVRAGSLVLRCAASGPLSVVHDPATGVRIAADRVLLSASADASVVNRRRCRTAPPPAVGRRPPRVRPVAGAARLTCPAVTRVSLEVAELAGPPGARLGRRVLVRDGGRLLLAATVEPGRAVLAAAPACR